MNKHDDLVEVSLVYGWKARDGTIYQGEGYPAPLRIFLLDNQNCSALLVKPDATTIQSLTERVAELVRDRDALHLAMHEIDIEAGNTIPPDGKDAAFAALNQITRLINPFRRATLSNGETK